MLRAARELFLHGGPEAVTMRAVAERVGVTATALYRHFESKDALLDAVQAWCFEEFAGYLYRALAGATPEDRLRRTGAAYLTFALERPESYRAIFLSTPPHATAEPRPWERAATFRFLMDRVRECLEAGALRPGPVEAVALSIWAHVHGLVALHLTGTLGMDEAAFRAAYRDSVERLFVGLGVPAQG